MAVNLAAFHGVPILVIVTPGQDAALTIRNTLLGGLRPGVLTAAGVASGQFIWTVATSAGLAALIVASEPVFTALKFAGAAYLVFLAAQALYAAVRPRGDNAKRTVDLPRGPARLAAYRQGMLSNLGNPKMAVFFSSLLPQFIAPGHASFATLLMLGLLFNVMTLTWLTGYALAGAPAGHRRPAERGGPRMEAGTGVGLVGPRL